MEDNTPIFAPPEPDNNIPPTPEPGQAPPEPGGPARPPDNRDWAFACLAAAGLLCLVLAGGILLASSGLLSRTLSAQPTGMPIPTFTMLVAFPAFTPTPDAAGTQSALDATSAAAAAQATITQAGSWTPLLDETFDHNSNGWRSGHFDSSFATIDFAIQGGVYRWDATAHQAMMYAIPVRTQPLTDFFMSADVYPVSGTPDGEVGLGLRENGGGDYYYFTVSQSTRKFAFLKWMGSEWSTVQDWTKSDAISAGSWNHLAVLAQGSQFSLFVNGQQVGQVSDGSIAKGINLLGIALDQAGSHGSFQFDDVIVRVPGR